MADIEVFAGPYFYERGAGTLYAADTDAIFEETGCKCSIRERANYNGKRGLTISGPASKTGVAKSLAEEAIKKNQTNPRSDANKGGGKPRNVCIARHADSERKRAQYQEPPLLKRK